MARGDYFKFPDLAALKQRVAGLGLQDQIGFAEGREGIAKPLELGGLRLANRIAMHPMEGWDADPQKGTPTPDVLRRWKRMGASGAGLLWGVEAMAVDFEYRANGAQLVLRPESQGEIGEALKGLRAESGALKQVVGAQVTCSGRYSYGRTKGTPPLLVYHHPELDKRLGAGPDTPLMTDMQMEDMVGLYVRAAKAAREAGFDFIDIKACHRYWLNETLAAKNRPGQYGGSFENRTKIFLMIVDGIQRELGKDFPLGTRLSATDGIPHEEDPASRREGLKGLGRPSAHTTPYVWGWSVDEQDPLKADLGDSLRLAKLLREKGLKLFNITAGSPYSNPHLSRPTETPPSDGYQPSHDPLKEVALHLGYAKAFKQALPDAVVVGTGYSYLRHYKLAVMEWALGGGYCDAVGFGRAFLSFPDEAAALLAEGVAKPGKGRQICNGDSSCTSGPRLGLKSGCIFDPYYAETMAEIRRRLAEQGITKK